MPKTTERQTEKGEKKEDRKRQKDSGQGSSKKSKSDEFGDDNPADLGGKKFVRVSEYKGRYRVDIREFYETSDGELKPGKKGISLNTAEFQKLVKVIPKLQEML